MKKVEGTKCAYGVKREKEGESVGLITQSNIINTLQLVVLQVTYENMNAE